MPIKLPEIFTLGNRLRDAREDAEHVQKESAALCGYSLRMWIYWEHGEMIPSSRAMKAIIKVYPSLQNCI